jgi:hypothetical protein
VCGALLAATVSGAATLPAPDVPFLPQSDALCGAASLAMVLRYWGVPDVTPEDFASALNADGTGIATDALQRLTESRGFRAFVWSGAPSEAVAHLENGRPLIVLLAAAPGRYHYVVMLAWANHRVMFHDPAVGPFRTMDEDEWRKRWNAAGGWTLLALPFAGAVEPGPVAAAPVASTIDACAVLVQPGVALALAGDEAGARERLTEAAALCPEASAPWREMAALELRHESWVEAAKLATEAVRREPGDRLAWKLLATSRFLAGRRADALAAWNRVDEPRLELVQVRGLTRTSSRVAYEYLDEEPGTILTPSRLRRVEHRIEALPAAQLSRVSYRPHPGGAAELDVDIVERPAFPSPRLVLLQSVVRGASERTMGADVFVLTRAGEIARLGGEWQVHRSHAALSVSSARFLALPGIVTAETAWDEESYRLGERERRVRGSVSLAHWWRADTRTALAVAADDWGPRGRSLSPSADVEERVLGDRVRVGMRGAGFWSAGAPFYAASARASLRTGSPARGLAVRVDTSWSAASATAPRTLWPGAGTGAGRSLLLRAHPLLHDGVIDGAAFGNRLWAGSVEGQVPLATLGPARLRAAVFVDAARVLAPERRPVLVDVGLGLRLHPPGWKSAFRIDVASSRDSLRPRLSAGWQSE